MKAELKAIIQERLEKKMAVARAKRKSISFEKALKELNGDE